MRVANPEAIRKGEKALVDAIASNFDRGVIQKIFKRVHNLDVGDDIQCKNAALGVHGEKVAYSMNFEVLVNLSVFLDRSGNFISISSSGVAPESPARVEQPLEEKTESPHFGETAVRETESVKVREEDADLGGGTYEAVLKEFVPIESESGKPHL